MGTTQHSYVLPPAAAAAVDSSSSFALLLRAREGDEAARNELCARYLPRLRRWAHGRLPVWAREHLDTEDIVQDALMKSVRRLDPLPRLKKTLGEHYRSKREHYGLDHPDFYESDLRNLFSDAPQYAKHMSAARFLRRIRKEVRSTVASFTDSYQYTIDRVLEKIIERCRELNLRLTESEEATKTDFMVFLTVQTMNYLHSGRHRVAL